MLSPIKVGETYPPWPWKWRDRTGAVVDLSGTVAGNYGLTMNGVDEAGNLIKRPATGVWTIPGPTTGDAIFTPSAVDVQAAGRFALEPYVTMPNGKLLVGDTVQIVIEARLPAS